MIDRAKLVRMTHLWLAASAAGLAILGWMHLLNGYLILLFVFLIGASNLEQSLRCPGNSLMFRNPGMGRCSLQLTSSRAKLKGASSTVA
jgi:hypothetical protein